MSKQNQIDLAVYANTHSEIDRLEELAISINENQVDIEGHKTKKKPAKVMS